MESNEANIPRSVAQSYGGVRPKPPQLMGRRRIDMKSGFIIKILLAIHVLVFIFSVELIVAMHTMPPPALAVFRIPQNLREVGPQIGMSWPTSLRIYHFFLLFFFTIILLNGIGLLKFDNQMWRSICKVSSFFGILLTWSVSLFFLLPLTLDGNFYVTNIKTALVYSLIAFVLFIVNLLTFTVAQRKFPA